MIPTTYTFDVSGMGCGACTSGVQQMLEQLPGVTHAAVTLNPGLASVTVDPARAPAAHIAAAITAAGYPATHRIAAEFSHGLS